MKKNTFSLLNSTWMISDSAASAMIPYLISLTKGVPVEKGTPEVLTSCFAEFEQESTEYNVVQDMRSDAKYIPVLAIKNTIYKYDQECGPRGTQSMMALMEEWKANDSVMGVVLEHDSGGGQSSGTRAFAKYINEYPKPVVSFIDGVSGSADYWIAAAAKGGIIMSPYADASGCIGTMYRRVNLEGILRNQGAVIEDIYPPESPRKNEEDRALNDNNTLPLITNILSPNAKLFIGDLKSFRPQIKEEAFEGAIYLPEASVQMGLVDRLGTRNDAFDEVIRLSKTTPQPRNNQNLNNMSNTHAKVSAVLGLTAALASTDKGSYLNDEQLDTLNTALETSENKATELSTQLETATAATTKAESDLATAVTAHTSAVSAIDTQIDGLVAAAGITAAGTTAEKLTALEGHYAAINKRDGAAPTQVKTDPNQPAETSKYLDASAAHNQLADLIKR